MTIKELQQDWIDWNKTGAYEGVRFGQFVFNERGYEFGNSYNDECAGSAYKTLFDSLTFSVG